jgi:hypothetical protein
MTLAELRDLFIIIFAVVGIGAAVFVSLMAFVLYRKLRDILDSGRAITGDIRSITSSVSQDLVKPLASISGIVQGVAKVLEFLFERRKEDKGGK